MLSDSRKTKAQLIEELESLRNRVAAFEQLPNGTNACRTNTSTCHTNTVQRSDFLQDLFVTAPVGLCYLDTELRYVFINNWLADINGLSVEQHVGRKISEILPAVASGIELQFRQVIETGEPIFDGTVEAETPANPGVKRHFQRSYLPVKSIGGTVIGISCVVQDVTQRKRADESSLKESQSVYQSLVEHIPQTVFRKDLDGQITFACQKLCEALQRPLKDILGRTDYDFFPKTLAEKYRADDSRVVETGEDFDSIEEHFAVDGQRQNVRIVKTPIRDADGQIIGVQGIFWDVTERLQAQLALQESEEKYRTLVESSPYCIHQIDSNGQIMSMNRAGLQMIGEEDESAVIGVPYLSAVCEEDRARITKLMDAAFLGEYSEFEFRGTVGLEFRSNFVPICDAEGNVDRLLGITQDITERRQAEEALCESEQRVRGSLAQFRTLVETIPYGIHESDTSGIITFSNLAHAAMHGYNVDEMIGKPVWTLLATEEDAQNLREYLKFLVETEPEPTSFYSTDRTTDGRLIETRVDWDYKRDLDGNVMGYVCVVTDITERKRAEETLNALQTAISEVTGEELFARVINMLIQSLGMSYAHIGELVEDNHTSIRTIACYQGDQQVAEVSTSLIGTPCETVVGKTFQIYRGKLWEQFPDNEFLRTHRYQYYVGMPIFSQAGKPLGMLCAMSEKESPGLIDFKALFTLLAARCGAEIERRQTLETLHQQQAALSHASRVAVVGELASGIIHEISQPLYAISNFSGACRRTLERVEFEGSAEVADNLDRITQATKTAQEIVVRLRGYLKRQGVQQSTVVLNEAINEALKLLAFEIRNQSVTVDCDVAPKITVLANPVQLQQVFVNLILNACEAQDNVPVKDRRILIQTSIAENEVEVTVEDNGVGISEEAAQHLFEPFFTTKAEGLGMGMAVSKNIINQHNGKIWFASSPHKGTVFHFTLPVFRTIKP